MRPRGSSIVRVAAAAAALVSAPASGAELPTTGSLPLVDVVGYARAHNPELQAARDRASAARSVPPQAAAWDDPVLAAESWNSPRAVPYDRAENNILKLSQRLPFPGKLGLKGRMAEREADVADAEARMTELAVVEAVKDAYWDLWAADRRLEVLGRDLALARELSAGAAERYAVGTGAQPDVLRADVERTHVATRLVTTRLGRETATARLNELLSRAPDEPLGTPHDPDLRHVPGPLDRLLALARQNRPELAARSAAVARNQDAVALARREYLPDFDLTFERFYNLDQRDGYGAMIGMTLPWPFVYRRNAGLEEARARLGAEEAMRRRTGDQVAAAVKTALAAVQAAAAEHDLLAATHIPQAEQSLAASRAAYAAGQLEFTGLLDSLRMVESTHIEHFDAAAAFAKAYASLEAAVGTDLPEGDAP
jgi:outer membrane protein, heavy metal efflux system